MATPRRRHGEADYKGNWFPHTDGEPREDRTRSFRASVHNRTLTWQGFSPQVPVVHEVHEVRKTNAQLFDHERTGGELRFVRLFLIIGGRDGCNWTAAFCRARFGTCFRSQLAECHEKDGRAGVSK